MDSESRVPGQTEIGASETQTGGNLITEKAG